MRTLMVESSPPPEPESVVDTDSVEEDVAEKTTISIAEDDNTAALDIEPDTD